MILPKSEQTTESSKHGKILVECFACNHGSGWIADLVFC